MMRRLGVDDAHLAMVQHLEVHAEAEMLLRDPAAQPLRPLLTALSPQQHPDPIRTWLDDPAQRLLLLGGPPGVGKTFAGLAAALEASVGAAMPCGKVSVLMPLQLRTVIGSRLFEFDHDEQREVSDSGVLLIDDLARMPAPRHQATLAELVASRCQRLRRTIITMECPAGPASLADLEEWVSEAATVLLFGDAPGSRR